MSGALSQDNVNEWENEWRAVSRQCILSNRSKRLQGALLNNLSLSLFLLSHSLKTRSSRSNPSDSGADSIGSVHAPTTSERQLASHGPPLESP